MKNRLLALIVMCSFQVGGIIFAGEEGQVLEPESGMQKQIARTVSVVMNHWEKQASEEDVIKAIEELEKTRPRCADILPQLVLYRASVMADEKEYAATTIIIGTLFPKVSATDTLEMLVPYLKSANLTVYGEIRGILDSLPSRHGDVKGDYYQSFEPYLKAAKDGPSEALIEYMYGRLPDEAFKTLVRSLVEDSPEKTKLMESARNMIADQRRSDHKSSTLDASGSADVGDVLSDLSQHPEWWVKLYVAEKMKQNPKLRAPELIEQLKNSKHAVVRETVQEIEGEKK